MNVDGYIDGVTGIGGPVFSGLRNYYWHTFNFSVVDSLGLVDMNRIIAVLLNRLMTWIVSDELWERAQSWVNLYENKEISSEEKRERVFIMLEAELKTLGLDLGTSLLNFAIEAAVQYVRRQSK